MQYVPQSIADTSLIPQPHDLTQLNTLGLSSVARAFVTLRSPDELETLSSLASQYAGLLVLGGGSNMVLPAHIQSLVVFVALKGIALIEARPDAWVIEAGAGETWHQFVSTCIDRGWDGLENLALIPGTVGAAPVQNIGAYGVELAERCEGVTAWNVRERRLVYMPAHECRFAYRDSVFKHCEPGEWVIVSVRFVLPRPWQPVLDYPDLRNYFAAVQSIPAAKDVFKAVCQIRREKLPDPALIGNAGSFFKNPIVSAPVRDGLRAQHPGLVSYPQPDGRYKLAAGWLIDQCGWKGKQLGAAGVHDRQALVLVNKGGATAEDVMALARAIQRDVAARYSVMLEPEPVVWEAASHGA